MSIPIVLLADEDGGFTAICDMFSIVTEGDSRQEAISHLKEAIECHLEGVEKSEKSLETKYEFVINSGMKQSTAYTKVHPEKICTTLNFA